jgi:hypothetical protein
MRPQALACAELQGLCMMSRSKECAGETPCSRPARRAFILSNWKAGDIVMSEGIKPRVEDVLCDARLDQKAKVAKLRQLEADALARQRASTEGMEPHRPNDGEDLKTIERALLSLGEKPIDQGPASL